ncbi:MAG TPA: hypothetical protein VJ951_07580, partial [Bacteroidales bacterium]|nr:hypothetical protein [Bacteroidales bacterium]
KTSATSVLIACGQNKKASYENDTLVVNRQTMFMWQITRLKSTYKTEIRSCFMHYAKPREAEMTVKKPLKTLYIARWYSIFYNRGVVNI